MHDELDCNRQFKFAEHDNGTTVCCYSVADSDTFNKSIAREGRGITFNSHGRIVGRPLHKFFNVGERAETKFDAIDWTTATRAMVKMDGSLIHTVCVPSGIWQHSLKSKKSYTSEVAIKAGEWMDQYSNYRVFCDWCVERDLTAIFEWTAPDSRIVVFYEQPKLALLHVRYNLSGRYKSQYELEALAAQFDLELVQMDEEILELCHTDPSQLLNLTQTREGMEGWVIQFDDGEMVKLKTKWYLDRHGA